MNMQDILDMSGEFSKSDKIMIHHIDSDGNVLCVGDIFSENKIGDIIWNEFIIMQPPLGVIMMRDNVKCHTYSDTVIDIDELIYVKQIRQGVAKLVEYSDSCLRNIADSNGYIRLDLTDEDGMFYNWECVKKIGNVYDM